MKLLGSLTDYIKSVFKKDGQDVTLRPNQGTTYTAARDVQLPPGDADHVVVSADSTQTLTNKTFDADGTGNVLSNVEDANIKSGAAIDAAKIADGSVSSTEFQHLDGVTSDIQGQIDAKADDSALTTHIGDTTTHGTTGDIVGTSDTQTLTNKTFDADSNTLSNIDDGNIKAGANIDATKIGTGIISNTELNYLNGLGSQVAGTVDTQLISNKTLSAFKYNTTTVSIASNTFAKSVESIMYVTGGSGPLNTITGGADGDVKILVNELGSDLTIANDSGADGIITGSGADLSLNDDSSLTIIYRASESRWKVVGGAGSGGGLELANVSGTLNPAAKNTHYLTDSSGGAFTITLPAGEVGAVLRFSDVAASWDTNSVTLDGDGAETIDGDTTLELDVESTWVQLMWDGSEWKVDHAFVPQAADFTGDLNVTGNLDVSGTSQLDDDVTVGTDALHVDVSTERVGINTTSPQMNLHIDHNSGSGGIRIQDNNDRYVDLRKVSTTNNFEFYNSQNSSVAMAIKESNGHIGIGIATPSYKLHTQENQNAISINRFENTDNTNGSSRQKMEVVSGTVIGELTSISTAGVYIGTNSNHDVNFIQNGSVKAHIDTSGNFAIGTETPDAKLHVETSSGTDSELFLEAGTGNFGTVVGYVNNGSGRSWLGNKNNAGGTNNRINFGFGTTTSGEFQTNVMTINHSGDVGIGTNSPTSSTLHIHNKQLLVDPNGGGNEAVRIGTQAINEGKVTCNQPNGTNGIVLRAGTSSNAIAQKTGTLAWVSTSDERLKENIQDYTAGLSTILALRPVTYEWKHDKTGYREGTQTGFVAQEVELVLPKLVTEYEPSLPEDKALLGDGVEAKHIGMELEPHLVQAIQELKTELDAAKARIAVLEGV